jgi:hypothetical protein
LSVFECLEYSEKRIQVYLSVWSWFECLEVRTWEIWLIWVLMDKMDWFEYLKLITSVFECLELITEEFECLEYPEKEIWVYLSVWSVWSGTWVDLSVLGWLVLIWVFGIFQKGNMTDLSVWSIPKRKYDWLRVVLSRTYWFECLEWSEWITGWFECLECLYKCIQVFGIFQKGIMVDLSVWSGIRIDLSVWSWFWVFGIFNWCWLVLIVVDLSVWNIPKTVYEWCDRSENTLTVLNMIR